MSSYIDHKEVRVTGRKPGGDPAYIVTSSHCWADFTATRLEWLYGEGREKTPQARADLAAWNALGQRVAA